MDTHNQHISIRMFIRNETEGRHHISSLTLLFLCFFFVSVFTSFFLTTNAHTKRFEQESNHITIMSLSSSKPSRPTGGLKGFLERATISFGKAFDLSREWGWYLAQKGGTVGLFLASTSMVVLMPLIFEINREVMVRTPHTRVLCRILVLYVRVVIVVLSVVL
jgi:uncharacterized membrane protein (UPF0136 family)